MNLKAYAEHPSLTMSIAGIFHLPNLVEILMREQVSNEDLIKINKERATVSKSLTRKWLWSDENYPSERRSNLTPFPLEH